MAGLECVCGEVFRAQFDVEPTGCVIAWLFLLISVAVHMVRCACTGGDDEDDSEDEPSVMYS